MHSSEQWAIEGPKWREQHAGLVVVPIPFMVYSYFPGITGLFLLIPSAHQFAFSVLQPEYRQSSGLTLLAAACEFYIIMMWMAMAHVGLDCTIISRGFLLHSGI